MFSNISFTTREVSILIAISYTFFWMSVSAGIQYTFYPKEAESKGATPTQYGLVFATESFVMLVLSPFTNRLLSRCSLKTIFMVSIYITGCVLLGFAFTDRLTNGDVFIWLCVGLRVAQGTASVALYAAIYVLVPLTFAKHLSLAFVIQDTMWTLGEIMGPSIGAVLYEWGGYQLPFLVLGVLMLSCAPFVSRAVGGGDDTLNKGPQKSANIIEFMSDTGIVLHSLEVICSQVIIGFIMSTLEPHLRQFDLGQKYIGSIFAIISITFVVFTPVWSRLSKSGFEYNTLSIIASLFSLTGLTLIGPLDFIPFHTNVWLIVLSIVFIGIGTAGNDFLPFVSALNDSIHRRGYVDDISTYSLVSTMFCFSTSLGFTIGSSFGGFLLERIGYKNANLVIFVIQTTFILLLLIHKSHKKAKTKDEERKGLIDDMDKMV